MACPVCSDANCRYWQMWQDETWHPVPADLGVKPPDHLRPLWRLEPNHGATTMVAGVDPREACFIVANGLTFDGRRFSASFEDRGLVEMDGRVSLRLKADDPDGLSNRVATA